ncbi:MAG: PASTA domain-containing protein [Proteobacteria bacterium]|nr:PASTA domain-containing protein [Pseudomonadota bacterium]
MNWFRAFLYFWVAIAVFVLSGYLTVSVLLKAGGTVICPDVRGKNVDDAKQLVQSKGLSLAVVKYERRNDVPYNHITVQKPEANISTRKGRIVLVIVSEGPELIRVPVLTGQMVDNVGEILKGINLKIEKTIYVPSPKVGKIIAQTPKGGEDMLEGKGITLFVGTEQKMLYVMPDVKALDLSELSDEMDKKGIKYKITYEKSEYNMRLKPAIEASIPLRTIFKADDEIEIKAIPGG